MRLEHALAYNNDAVRASLHMIQLICWQTLHEDYSKDDGGNHYPSTLSPQAHLPHASCMHQPNPPAQTVIYCLVLKSLFLTTLVVLDDFESVLCQLSAAASGTHFSGEYSIIIESLEFEYHGRGG